MLSAPSPRLARALLVGFALVLSGTAPGGRVLAQSNFEKVRFDTVDGVTLRGNLYVSPAGMKAPTVIMLHPLKTKEGKPADQTVEGWQQLANELFKAKYTVLTFDFRGHGESTAVNQQTFQKLDFPHNTQHISKARKDLTTLQSKDIQTAYLPHLVDDVAAARMFLDSRNDRGLVNSSNLIVLGAGEGATIGALWMASEYKRRRGEVTATPTLLIRPPVPTGFGDPEGKDIIAGVFISMSPSLGNRTMPINNWLRDITAKRTRERTQLLFVYGGKDPKVDTNNQNWLKAVRPGYERKKDGSISVKKSSTSGGLEKTEDYKIDSKDQSVALLPGGEVANYLTKTYLPGLLADVVPREPEQKENKTRYYYWVPEVNGKIASGQYFPAKLKDEEFLRSIPLRMFGVQ